MRNVIVVTKNELQRVLARRQFDARIRLTRTEVQVIAIRWDFLIERRQIRIDQALRDKIQPEAPDGWLPLDAAARTLGVARQTVLHKVQRGELTAVHVNRGRRKGLRIQVKHDQAGLFDTP